MKTGQNEKIQFSLRSKPSVHERLTEAAAWRGQSLHAFVLGAAIREADEVLARRDRIELTPEDAEVVLRLLESEAAPNAELIRAFQKRAEVLNDHDH
mgnify:CR=1 FL=1|jgi:uncharacterized protein (DUF1778 family)